MEEHHTLERCKWYFLSKLAIHQLNTKRKPRHHPETALRSDVRASMDRRLPKVRTARKLTVDLKGIILYRQTMMYYCWCGETVEAKQPGIDFQFGFSLLFAERSWVFIVKILRPKM